MFKLMLYNLGIIKLKSLRNKIEFLRLNNINPFEEKYVNIQIETIGINIKEYIKTLEIIINHEDPVNNTIDYVFDLKNHKTSIGLWCSDNGMISNDGSEQLDNLLEISYSVNEIYILLSKPQNKFIGKPYYNTKKIYPHIINIENIVSKLITRLIT